MPWDDSDTLNLIILQKFLHIKLKPAVLRKCAFKRMEALRQIKRLQNDIGLPLTMGECVNCLLEEFNNDGIFWFNCHKCLKAKYCSKCCELAHFSQIGGHERFCVSNI